MKRSVLLVACLSSGCGGAAEQEPSLETFRNGRDGLCVIQDGEQLRAGLVTYGSGDTNCSLAGSAVRDGDSLTITPRGEQSCRVTVAIGKGRAVIGPRSNACAYYCGPGANFSGTALTRDEADAPVTDFAGDPLC